MKIISWFGKHTYSMPIYGQYTFNKLPDISKSYFQNKEEH